MASNICAIVVALPMTSPNETQTQKPLPWIKHWQQKLKDRIWHFSIFCAKGKNISLFPCRPDCTDVYTDDVTRHTPWRILRAECRLHHLIGGSLWRKMLPWYPLRFIAKHLYKHKYIQGEERTLRERSVWRNTDDDAAVPFSRQRTDICRNSPVFHSNVIGSNFSRISTWDFNNFPYIPRRI
jgi:hypothetical protein